MIRFFRSIRQSLLAQGRFTRYLTYAIGEIVLVVVGILIALQVNDWNERRKSAAFEQDILMLIDQNLQKDTELLRAEMENTALAINLTERLLEQVARNEFSDSLNRWMGKIICFERFRSHSSAFEVLKEKGIGNVHDKELQLALISYYDGALFRLYESLNDVLLSFNADWVPTLKSDFIDFKFRIYAEPIDQRAFLERPATIVLFKLYKDNRAGQLRHMERALKDIDHIQALIKQSHE
jgi:hypothetical protein